MIEGDAKGWFTVLGTATGQLGETFLLRPYSMSIFYLLKLIRSIIYKN
jgi:hypothetical protein